MKEEQQGPICFILFMLLHYSSVSLLLFPWLSLWLLLVFLKRNIMIKGSAKEGFLVYFALLFLERLFSKIFRDFAFSALFPSHQLLS